MGTCKYCGQKAGFFSDAHPACIEKAKQAIQNMSAGLSTAIAEGKQSNEIKEQVDKTLSGLGIPKEQLMTAFTDGWSAGAKKRSMDKPIDNDEFSKIADVYRAVGLTEDGVRNTSGYRAMAFSFIIWMVLNDKIEPYQGPVQFNLQHKEVPVFGMANVLVKEQRTISSYAGSYSGASIRIASGLYYHLGGVRGHKVESTSWQEVDYGDFLMTTAGVYFGGREKGVNFRIPYKHVIRFQPYSDAVGICQEGKKEKIFAPQQIPETGWFLFNVLQALSAKELSG